MHLHRPITVLLVSLIVAITGVDLAYADQPTCGQALVQASFKASLSAYQVTTTCSSVEAGFVNWISQGSYDTHTGIAREDVHVSIVNAFSATATTTVTCLSDPWLGPSFGAGKVSCTNGTVQEGGQVNDARFWLDWLRIGFSGSSLPNSTGFSYDRPALVAQRDAALKAQAEAVAALHKQNQHLRQGLQLGPAVIAPTVIAPLPDALFLQNNVVPIRIAALQGIVATSYLVRIEIRNAQGAWTVVTQIPVGAAEASSPSGYLGWGAPGNGKGAAMIAGSGTYRVSAQVATPQQTRWGEPVQFVVTSPNQAIRKGPKAIGPKIYPRGVEGHGGAEDDHKVDGPLEHDKTP